MNHCTELIKYPRTPHLSGSRLQPGDEDLSQIPFGDLQGKHLVVEEKCDGANSAISFGREGDLRLQSRGHYLTGGYRERHYHLLKQWANVHRAAFYEVLGDRYILYGEWMYAKHSVYYDALPHYFLEFDILDRENGCFLDTPSRHKGAAGGVGPGTEIGRLCRPERTFVFDWSVFVHKAGTYGTSAGLL